MYCHNRLQAGEPQKAAELALGGQRSTEEGRQVDRANLLVTVAAGMFRQIRSDMCYGKQQMVICFKTSENFGATWSINLLS